MGQQAFGLPSMYDPQIAADEQELARRQRIADMLRMQSMAPMGGTEMAGKVAIRNSPLEGIAKVFSAYMANRNDEETGKLRTELSERRAKEMESSINAQAEALFGSTGAPNMGRPEGVTRDAMVAGGFPQPQDRAADPEAAKKRELYAIALRNRDKAMAETLMKNRLELTPEMKNLQFKGMDPRAVGQAEMDKMRREGERVMSADQVLLGNDNQPVYKAPSAPSSQGKMMNDLLQGAGIDPASPQGRAAYAGLISKETTHQPGTSVTVSTGKKFGEVFAGEIAKDVASTKAAAQSAHVALDNLGNIEKALATGKVTAGPGTTPIIYVQQALGLPSGKDGLVQTRTVIQGLAKMTLAARGQMKGQGQISDYEGKLLERAEAGKIEDLTVPEIKTIVGVSKRAANYTISQHESNVKNIRNDPELRQFAPYYEVKGPQTLRFDAQGNMIP